MNRLRLSNHEKHICYYGKISIVFYTSATVVWTNIHLRSQPTHSYIDVTSSPMSGEWNVTFLFCCTQVQQKYFLGGASFLWHLYLPLRGSQIKFPWGTWQIIILGSLYWPVWYHRALTIFVTTEHWPFALPLSNDRLPYHWAQTKPQYLHGPQHCLLALTWWVSSSSSALVVLIIQSAQRNPGKPEVIPSPCHHPVQFNQSREQEDSARAHHTTSQSGYKQCNYAHWASTQHSKVSTPLHHYYRGTHTHPFNQCRLYSSGQWRHKRPNSVQLGDHGL